jgi:hypothetical protein
VQRGGVVLRLERREDVGEPTGDLEAVDHRLQVEPGPTHQDGTPGAPGDVGERVGHGSLERVHLERLPRIHQVDDVVADLGLLGRRGLGGADVHAPVHLHRVDRDQLDIAPVAGERHRERRLPARGGAHDGDRRRRPVREQPVGPAHGCQVV